MKSERVSFKFQNTDDSPSCKTITLSLLAKPSRRDTMSSLAPIFERKRADHSSRKPKHTGWPAESRLRNAT
jgi:hypothetical protein